jgi:hypothetical protein
MKSYLNDAWETDSSNTSAHLLKCARHREGNSSSFPSLGVTAKRRLDECQFVQYRLSPPKFKAVHFSRKTAPTPTSRPLLRPGRHRHEMIVDQAGRGHGHSRRIDSCQRQAYMLSASDILKPAGSYFRLR